MEKIFGILKQLQEILSQKYAIEKEILEIPKTIETKQEILNRLKKSYLEKNQEFESIKQDLQNRNKEMSEAERRREESEKKMDIITTQREYEALDKEIRDASDNEQRARRYIQKRENDLEDISDALEREIQMIKMQEEELKVEHEKIQSETTGKRAILADLIAREAKIAPGIDENILFKFQRIIRNKSGLGIVTVQNNICNGCHMVLPAQFVNDVRSGNAIHFCPYCSRILFWEASDEPALSISSNTDDDSDFVGGLADLLDEQVEL